MSRPRRRGRDINGVLLLDKPQGYSSNDILQKVKRIYQANKAGHTGALDPLATGMLPICLGEATKFSHFLLDADKRYRVIARLGERTNTSDADGEVVQTRPIAFNQKQLDVALDHFRGDSQQIPSMYSALKYQGKPLYEYARQGIEVPREARHIKVYELLFIRWQGDELELEIHCSKGTYIRSIIDDLGEMLGCGAHVIYLRRLQVADYPVTRMVTFTQLQQLAATAEETGKAIEEGGLDPLLLPVDTAAAHLPEINISDVLAGYVLQGQAVWADNLPGTGMVRISHGDNHRFIGIGEINDQGRLAPRRLIAGAGVVE